MYRFAGSRILLAVAFLVPAAGAAGLVWDMARDDGTPIAVPVATAVVFLALFVLVARLILATSTVVDEDGVVIQHVFSVRAIPWPHVQGVEIEEPHTTQESAPRRITVLYDAAGARRELPFVNDRGVPDLAREVELVRRLWLAHRGPDWRASPNVAESVARRRDPATPLLTVVGLTALGAFLVGGTLTMVLLAAGAYPGPFDPGPGFLIGTVLHPLVLVIELPVVTTAVVVSVVVARRRR